VRGRDASINSEPVDPVNEGAGGKNLVHENLINSNSDKRYDNNIIIRGGEEGRGGGDFYYAFGKLCAKQLGGNRCLKGLRNSEKGISIATPFASVTLLQ